MKETENPLKAALADGRPQVGLWISASNKASARISEDAQFDWVMVDADAEPDAAPWARDLPVGQTAKPFSVITRLPSHDSQWIARAGQIGAPNVFIPGVTTPDDAVDASDALRSKGAGDLATDDVCLILQVGTRDAVENAGAIAATRGVDCVFVSAAELAADLGHPGDPAHEDVTRAVDMAIAGIRAAKKAAGTVTFDRTTLGKLSARGVTFQALGGNAVLLSPLLREHALAGGEVPDV